MLAVLQGLVAKNLKELITIQFTLFVMAGKPSDVIQ